MGRGWVHNVRMASGAKKGKLFTKISKEITVAVKMGGPSSEANPRLRAALKEAQKNSMPKDTIDRAIKRGTGEGQEDQFEEIVYEGYAPHGVAVVVETLTDNKNRTVQDLRAQFVRGGGALGESGSVLWMFDRVASVIAKAPKPETDIEEAAILCGANEVQELDEGESIFFGAISDLEPMQTELQKLGWDISKAELSYKAKTQISLESSQEQAIQDFLELVNDNDDVKKIHLSL